MTLVPRVALTRKEAAESIGCSLSHFERHVQPHLRLIRSGSVRLVPVGELEKWAERSATFARAVGSSQRKRPRAGGTAGGRPREVIAP